EKNLAVIAKRPIANAAWKDLSQQPGMYQKYAAVYTDRLSKMKLKPAELGFADDNDGWAEMALRFTLSQSGVHTAIIGTTNPANAEANLRHVEKGPLPPETIEKIRAAFRRADPNGQW